jgi:hypothetical protein
LLPRVSFGHPSGINAGSSRCRLRGGRFAHSLSAFGITPCVKEKLTQIRPTNIGRALKKDRAVPALKGKSLAKPCDPLKRRIPIRTFYPPQERKLSGFIQTGTVRHGSSEKEPAA